MFSFTSPFTSDIWGVFVILYSATHSHLLQTLCFWEELYKSVVASWMILMNDYHMFPHRFHSALPLHHDHWDLPNTIFYKGIVRAYIIISSSYWFWWPMSHWSQKTEMLMQKNGSNREDENHMKTYLLLP